MIALGLLLASWPGEAPPDPPGTTVAPASTSTTGRDLPRSDTSSAADPDPLRYAQWAAIVDGGWSLALTAGWALSARSWDAPYPDGLVGLAAARVLYGTSWSVLLASEVALARALAGARWQGMSRGRFKNTWLFGFATPGGCASAAPGPCGLGIGGWTQIGARVDTELVPLLFVLQGGWIQGHVEHAGAYTLVESTWVQTPLSVRADLRLDGGWVEFGLNVGPSVFWGMHNAHVHPTEEERRLDVPLHEILPLDGGAGLGGASSVEVRLLRTITVDVELELGVAILAASRTEPHPALLHLPPTGAHALTWRKLSLGLGVRAPWLEPVAVSARYWTAAFDRRSLTGRRHESLALEFTVPIDLDREDEANR